ncbi:RNA polymerase sigma factor [Marivirga salinae]|uniref:RNA polymerase sigma factor n=1 Tax=Marivirga salinarum TaxID=3059078 RepID=A0AA49JGY9_9BACT|nr:RNA polymerase sigma factor [Marivirga sp. BDSF4-3]WKK77055.2 RNA polymerase sigma factor [Marivirga sp. BDSF4-3]
MNENEFLTHINENTGLIKRLINMYIDTSDEREDMFQEILMRCWISKDRFRGESKFSTWLYRLSLNSILTSLKKKSRLTTSPLDKEVEYIPGDKNNEESEIRSRLYLAIKKLDDIDKTIITMHLDAFTNPEIADFMGISVNHCNVKLFRIKNKLETILKDN